MERKKKREKPATNGNVTDVTSAQSGDVHTWHREPEQLGKRFASASTSEHAQQPPHRMFNWPFPRYPTAQQQSGQPQLHSQVTQQQNPVATQGPSQGGFQTMQPVSQLGWQNPEAFGQSTGPGQPPIQPSTGESGWSQASGVPSMGPRPPPPFLFHPPPPYSGPWDPVSWWGHNPYLPPFAYMYPGYGSMYPCPMPPGPPIPTIQRGVIKPPPGLSQKHHQMWEAQSMENTQLWTTTTQLWAALARADTEIALQRTKIVKLEADLQQIVKCHQGSPAPQESVPAHQSGAKRGRRKKDASVPVTSALSSPASDPNTSRASGVNARASTGNMECARQVNEMEREENDKSTLGGHLPELVYRPAMDERDEKSCALQVGSHRTESVVEKHPMRQTLGFQSPTNSSINSSLTVAKDDLAFSHLNHVSGAYKPSSLLAGRKDSSFVEQGFQETAAVSFFKNASNGFDHQVMMNGDVSFGALLNSGGVVMGADMNGNMIARDAMVRSQLQAHLDAAQVHPLSMRHANPSWHSRGDDGSDEQDEGGASVQDEDGADGDDEDDVPTLAGIHTEKGGNIWHLPFR